MRVSVPRRVSRALFIRVCGSLPWAAGGSPAPFGRPSHVALLGGKAAPWVTSHVALSVHRHPPPLLHLRPGTYAPSHRACWR